MSGMSATTGIGNASVTHHVIIRPPTASTFEAPCPTLKGLTKYKINATTTPASKEISLRFCFEIAANCGEFMLSRYKEVKESHMGQEKSLGSYRSNKSYGSLKAKRIIPVISFTYWSNVTHLTLLTHLTNMTYLTDVTHLTHLTHLTN